MKINPLNPNKVLTRLKSDEFYTVTGKFHADIYSNFFVSINLCLKGNNFFLHIHLSEEYMYGLYFSKVLNEMSFQSKAIIKSAFVISFKHRFIILNHANQNIYLNCASWKILLIFCDDLN